MTYVDPPAPHMTIPSQAPPSESPPPNLPLPTPPQPCLEPVLAQSDSFSTVSTVRQSFSLALPPLVPIQYFVHGGEGPAKPFTPHDILSENLVTTPGTSALYDAVVRAAVTAVLGGDTSSVAVLREGPKDTDTFRTMVGAPTPGCEWMLQASLYCSRGLLPRALEALTEAAGYQIHVSVVSVQEGSLVDDLRAPHRQVQWRVSGNGVRLFGATSTRISDRESLQRLLCAICARRVELGGAGPVPASVVRIVVHGTSSKGVLTFFEGDLRDPLMQHMLQDCAAMGRGLNIVLEDSELISTCRAVLRRRTESTSLHTLMTENDTLRQSLAQREQELLAVCSALRSVSEMVERNQSLSATEKVQILSGAREHVDSVALRRLSDESSQHEYLNAVYSTLDMTEEETRAFELAVMEHINNPESFPRPHVDHAQRITTRLLTLRDQLRARQSLLSVEDERARHEAINVVGDQLVDVERSVLILQRWLDAGFGDTSASTCPICGSVFGPGLWTNDMKQRHVQTHF